MFFSILCVCAIHLVLFEFLPAFLRRSYDVSKKGRQVSQQLSDTHSWQQSWMVAIGLVRNVEQHRTLLCFRLPSDLLQPFSQSVCLFPWHFSTVAPTRIIWLCSRCRQTVEVLFQNRQNPRENETGGRKKTDLPYTFAVKGKRKKNKKRCRCISSGQRAVWEHPFSLFVARIEVTFRTRVQEDSEEQKITNQPFSFPSVVFDSISTMWNSPTLWRRFGVKIKLNGLKKTVKREKCKMGTQKTTRTEGLGKINTKINQPKPAVSWRTSLPLQNIGSDNVAAIFQRDALGESIHREFQTKASFLEKHVGWILE